MTNLARAGLARLRGVAYRPNPTAYDALFPNGTFLTAPRPRRDEPAPPPDTRPPER